MEKYYEIAKTNLKYILGIHILIGVLFCVISPLLMGTNNLNDIQTFGILEFYISFIGIILLNPVFLTFYNNEIKELIMSKREKYANIYIVLIVEEIIIMAIILAFYLCYLKISNCSFNYFECYVGVMANSLFLGGLGILASGLSHNICIGYMIPVLFYVISYFSGGNVLWIFNLFSMTQGRFTEKYILLFCGISFINIALWYECIWKRN